MAKHNTASKKTSVKKPAKKKAAVAKPKKILVGKPKKAAKPADTAIHQPPRGPATFRARVRMYRHGLGDCFLITFPRANQADFHMLIDCGALNRDAQQMTRVVEHIRDTIRGNAAGKARLDVVVATHEHKDHLSGFNQARAVFNQDFDFGAVWLGWTENLTMPEIKKIKEAKKKVAAKLKTTLANSLVANHLDGVSALLGFSEDDDSVGSGKIAEALEYLKVRGKDAGNLQYLDPGTGPLELDGVDGVRVYVLGPPRDPILLKGSEVTEQLKKDGVVYHLSATGDAGVDALSAAVAALDALPGTNDDRYYPFAVEHRIAPKVRDRLSPATLKPNPYYKSIRGFVNKTYDDPAQKWRRIDNDWLLAFDQLALDLDNDTNNTSLVLAFEFVKTREVLLFVGDAQVGNWRSWANVSFKVPEREKPMSAHDLLNRTVFYKVGHHCSHNATLKKGGLELMVREDLVAFIPLDRETAAKQGKKDPVTGLPKGWEMPAPPLYKALLEKAGKRVVISDAKEPIPPEAEKAGVVGTDMYVDYFLE